MRINHKGSISPAIFSMLPNLVEIWLSNNQISGPLPYETIGDCPSLTHIGMMNNKISGGQSQIEESINLILSLHFHLRRVASKHYEAYKLGLVISW
jgi:hypothetical protein